jgi:hypothetical protein
VAADGIVVAVGDLAAAFDLNRFRIAVRLADELPFIPRVPSALHHADLKPANETAHAVALPFSAAARRRRYCSQANEERCLATSRLRRRTASHWRQYLIMLLCPDCSVAAAPGSEAARRASEQFDRPFAG